MIFFDQKPKRPSYSNEKFYNLEGYLTEKEAKETYAEFWYNNLGLCFEFFAGVKLFPYQEILLRALFEHNFNMVVAARGGSKSFIVAAFCCLYPLFHPNTRIVLASNSFRATRRLILQIEKFINAKGAELLKECFDNNKGKLEFRKSNDEMVLQVNGGAIIALPLNEKVRGTRGDILICDEFLQIPEDIYKFVLMPFLTAKNNIQEQLQIQEEEDWMIEQGIMKEEERTILDSDKKIIALTSASYDFEFAYRLYMEWLGKIDNAYAKKDKTEEIKEFQGRTYFVCRLSYEALPIELIEKDVVEEAKGGGEQNAAFQREYMAMFSSSSDGYFNIKMLHENTIKDGELPCVQLKGNKDSQYILAIDPSMSSSAASDHFAMGVYLLNNEERTITLVHSYAAAGGKLQDHIFYLYYLLTNFNIVFLTADLSGDGEGFNFIQVCNESSVFADKGYALKFVEGDLNMEESYIDEIRKFKNSYNLGDKKICYRQKYSSSWIRQANEHLQAQINRGKVKFAARLTSNENIVEKALQQNYSIFKNPSEQEAKLLDWIADQENLVEQTKRQLALIEPKVSSQGTMTFDLPQHLKRSKSPDRARRDSYACMVMGAWAARCYWDMNNTETKKQDEVFIPRFV